MLHDEADRARADSADRAKSVDNKASFLVVSAGVILPAAIVHRHVSVALEFSPIVFLFISIFMAAIALWPRKRLDVGIGKLYDLFFDSESDRQEMENRVVRMKVAAADMREARTQLLAKFVSAGFVSLLAGVVALAAAVVLSSK